MRPVVSVIVTSDYKSGSPESWSALGAALRGLARQDFREPAEFILVESADVAPEMPPAIKTILPTLRVIACPAAPAGGLKNAGVRAAAADLVALVDGDCVAEPGWLSAFVGLMRERPEIAVVSGRTHYGSRRFLDRAMALASRSYLDRGRTAPTRHVTINNAGFRRAALRAHPFTAEEGPHMSMLQADAMARAGHRFLFDPRLAVRHEYDGWPMEREIRRSMGYGVIKTRLLEPRLPYAWMARLGYPSIPLFLLFRMLHAGWNCALRRRAYNVAWYELPAALALVPAASLMEVPGMLRAVRGLPLDKTAFR